MASPTDPALSITIRSSIVCEARTNGKAKESILSVRKVKQEKREGKRLHLS
jgi:hypothetical protein